jgi:hypothetical protein
MPWDVTFWTSEWAVVSGSPGLFLIAIAIVTVGLWRAINWAYSSQVAGLRAQNDSLDQHIKLAQERLRSTNDQLARVEQALAEARAAGANAVAVQTAVTHASAGAVTASGTVQDAIRALGMTEGYRIGRATLSVSSPMPRSR